MRVGGLRNLLLGEEPRSAEKQAGTHMRKETSGKWCSLSQATKSLD